MGKRMLRAIFDGGVQPVTHLLMSRSVDRSVRIPLRHQPVFIIGAPRTGSTILYQALTNAFDVSYIDNLACRFSGNLPFGMWLSQKFHGARPHDNFKSKHGDTSRFGNHAPSECGAFWYRWLPRDRHFIDDEDVTPAMVEEIRREVSAVINRYDKPFVFKNMNAGQRLRLISRVFPEAKLIYLRRDPRNVVRSILKARATLGVPPGTFWSIRPRSFEKMMGLPEDEMVVAQVAAIEAQIECDLGLFPPGNATVVRFEDFSGELVQALGRFMGARSRPGGSLPEFRAAPAAMGHPRIDSLIALYFGAARHAGMQ